MPFSNQTFSKTKNSNHRNENLQNKAKFRDFILKENHPCVMAQSVFTSDHLNFHTYKNLGSRKAAQEILNDLKDYLSEYDFEGHDFFSFIAVFSDKSHFTEKQFETLLWKQLQCLHELDDQKWDRKVSDDPAEDNFSFSLAGKAFYMVGMHPDSSRQARQSPQPALVFNLHGQFEKLRKMGAYHKVRDKIRQRDEALQGNINPMLQDFGDDSEAKQYSGRKVGEDWKCPFHR